MKEKWENQNGDILKSLVNEQIWPLTEGRYIIILEIPLISRRSHIRMTKYKQQNAFQKRQKNIEMIYVMFSLH